VMVRRLAVACGLACLLCVASQAVAQDATTEPEQESSASGESTEPQAEETATDEFPLPPPPQPDPASVNANLEKALLSGAHPFCRQRFHPFDPSELSLCEFSKAAAERCPEFAKACNNLDREIERSNLDLSWLGTLAKVFRWLGSVLFWVLLGVAALAIIAAIVRIVRTPRAAAEEDAMPEPNAPDGAGAAPAAVPFDHDADRHLGRARSLAAKGEYALALVELHAAVVLRLDARGAIVMQRGRTNGDYARELRGKPELLTPFRELSRAVEGVHFGARRADAGLYEQTLQKVSSLLGPLAVCLWLAFGASACTGGGQRSVGSACGGDADGYGVLCSLLGESGSVRRRHRQLEAVDDSVGLVVVLPNSLEDEEWKPLIAWIEEGGSAVLTTGVAPIDKVTGVRRDGKYCKDGARLHDLPETKQRLIGSAPTLSGSSAAYADCGGDTFIGRVRLGGGIVTYLPTPHLLSNASLVAGDNASLLLPLLPTHHGSVELIGPWTRDSEDSPFASLRAAGLLPWLLQALALLLALSLYKGAPFGRRVALAENPRRRFREHVQALGERWADARASRAALSSYATWALEVLRERVPSATQASVAALAPQLARRSGRSEAEVTNTLVHARLAKEGDPDDGTEASHLATMRELSRLISETGGPR